MHLIVDLIFCPITSDFRANLDFFAKKSDLIVDLIVHLIVDLILSYLGRSIETMSMPVASGFQSPTIDFSNVSSTIFGTANTGSCEKVATLVGQEEQTFISRTDKL